MMRLITLFFAFALSFIPSVVAAEKVSLYVWDFQTRDRLQDDLTANLTREFEEALAALSDSFVVQNGRDHTRFLKHRDHINQIQTLAGASQDLLGEMKSFKVDQVVFGEVFDDLMEGTLVLTVTFENLQGQKVLIKSGSVPRAQRDVSSARKAMIDEMVSALTSHTRPVHRKTVSGFIFDLSECVRSSRTITCSFTVTNNGDDRSLEIYSLQQFGTRLFDSQSNQLLPSPVQIANQSQNTYEGTRAFLPGSIPTQVRIPFPKASTSTDTIVRLDVSCWESDRNQRFTVTFRNIPIKDE